MRKQTLDNNIHIQQMLDALEKSRKQRTKTFVFVLCITGCLIAQACLLAEFMCYNFKG